MSVAKVSQKTAMLLVLCLSSPLIIRGILPPEVESVSRVGGGSIEIRNLDYFAEKALLLFIFDEETGTNDIRDLSTSWLVIEQIDTSDHGILAIPIGRADPDWELVGTNNVTLWHWRLEKTFDLPYRSHGDPGTIFPFEVFTVSFFIATNLSRWFTATIDVPNFSLSVDQQHMDFNQSLWAFQAEGCPYFQRIDLNIFHDREYQLIIMMLYILLFIIMIVSAVLFKKTNGIHSSDFLRLSTSLLLFLPVLFFTFRNSIAPKYLTPFDILCFFEAIIFGLLLLQKLIGQGSKGSTNNSPNKEQEAKSNKITFMSIMKMGNLDEKVRNTIAERNLTLAGFTLAALTFIIGFYKDNLVTATSLISSLLFAMLLFFLGSQLAREAEYFWQIFSADISDYAGEITLMISFFYFINKNLQDRIMLLFPIILVVILGLYLVRGVWRIVKFYKEFRSLKESSEKE